MENNASAHEAPFVAKPPTPADLRTQQAEALAQHQAATTIEKALRACGLPYEVWIIAAEFADAYATRATALTAQLVAAHPAQEFTTCEAA
jgi:hypothetical protein